jgi:hypothetical protein
VERLGRPAEVAVSRGLQEPFDLAEQHLRMVPQISTPLIDSITSFDWTDGWASR